MNGISIHEFVKDLKTAKLFTAKQCLVIENLYIYFKDMKVYKVIIAVNPSMLKKAKKLGLNSQGSSSRGQSPYITTFFDDVPINIPDLKISSGSYIALYNVNDQTCSVFSGEESEEEQMAKLAAKKKLKNKSE